MAKIELKTLELHPNGRKSMLITWEFAPTIEAFSDYIITLERSESPEAGYSKLTTVSESANSYVDTDIRLFRFWKDTYVRMHIVAKNGSKDYYTTPTLMAYPPDVEALEFIRRLKITLENRKYGVGVPCHVFLRKHGGQTCPECYDPLKRRVIKSHCRTCFSVGYVDGFYDAIPMHVAFTPDQKRVMLTDRGSESVSAHNSYAAHSPVLNPGDLVYDARMGRLWNVAAVSTVERRRHVVKQNLMLEEVDKTSAYYQMCEERLKGNNND